MFAFHFEEDGHRYSTADGPVCSVTQMLVRAGLVDDRWFTEEGRRRGTGVHDATAAYDLGAVDVATYKEEWRDYLLQHVRLTGLVRPEWAHIEVPFYHPQFRFAGRPDRVGRVYGAQALAEVKSGPPEDVHGVQLALQAILVAPVLNLPAHLIQRYGWYLTKKKGFLEHYVDRTDFDRAREVIRQCCGV